MDESANVAITISRQLGSGGSHIGQNIAKKLNFKYLDREILVHTAYKLGAEIKYMQERDEKHSNIWENILRSFSLGSPAVSYIPPISGLISDKKLFETTYEIMRGMGERFNTVMVGRAGFYILKDFKKLIKVFIHASEEFRIKRIMDAYKLENKKEAERIAHESDHQRSSYIEEVVGLSWLDARNYHLCIDTSVVGFNKAEDLIIKIVESKYPSSIK